MSWLARCVMVTIAAGIVVGVALAMRVAPRDPSLVDPPVQARRVIPPMAARSARSAVTTHTPEGALRLEGQVISPDGTGVGGASVALATRPPRAVTTAADGRFVFDGVAAGAYVLTARTPALLGGPTVVRLSDETEPVVVGMVDGAALAVRVVDGRGCSTAGHQR